MARDRVIRVEALTRVEGEGGLFVRLRGDEIDEVRLDIYEPPRLFESLLRGRRLEEVPDITARICGICPVAYQMSAVHALEAALQVAVTPEIRQLRRLLYCGEWIESHALHVHLLQAPDFFGYDSGLQMAEHHKSEIERGLRLKKVADSMLDLFGGRAIHPINVAVGGFYRLPRQEMLGSLVAQFESGLEAAVEMTRWVATFDFPDFDRPYELVALVHPDEYPMNEGAITSDAGESIPADQFESAYEEFQVPHSTALHAIHKTTGSAYLTGPLARVNLNLDKLLPSARRLADEVSVDWPCTNPFKSIVARGLEIVHAFEEALSILRAYRPARPPRVEYAYRKGRGSAATEAPRGLLYHRYDVDDEGLVAEAKIVPPTSQNQNQIEIDLKGFLPQVLKGGESETARRCENLVRSYDPCISCSTHFLKLTIERE